MKATEQIEILEQQVHQLENENTRLTDQRNEVIGMNRRWQKFNAHRESHITRLSETNNQQESKIIALEQLCSKLNEEISELKKPNDIGLNTKWQRFNDQREAYITTLSKTNHQQQAKIIMLEQRCLELNEEISELKRLNVVLKKVGTRDQDVAFFSTEKQLVQKDEEIKRLQVRYTDTLKELREKIIQNEQLQKSLCDAPTFAGCKSSTKNTPDITGAHYYRESMSMPDLR